MTPAVFSIRYSPVNRAVLTLMGLGPAHSGVRVDDESVRVALGWGFRAELPRRAVHEVGPGTQSGWEGWGAHGWRGDWLVNGSSTGLVRIGLSPDARARVMGVPVRLSALRVSVTDPESLIALLSPARR